MNTKPVDLGYIQKQPSWLLHPKFFPSKIGGKPAWLDLKNLPSPKELTCKKCNDPLIFLCQIYAPYEDREDGFHRTLFVFICGNTPCCLIDCADNLVALRCQLPRKNDFYSFEPYEVKETEDFPVENMARMCDVCGIRGPFHCSKCKKIYYCSRKHQVLDWHKGHKQICPNLQKESVTKSHNFIITEAGKSILYQEWEVIVDVEDEVLPTEVNTLDEMEKLTKLMHDLKDHSFMDTDEDELDQYIPEVPNDKFFHKFKKRIGRHGDQVLRYDRGGTPLLIASTQPKEMLHIPNCQYCNGERQFEFQIMPQLLNDINEGMHLNKVDWGIIAIYSCKDSCNAGPAYKVEHVMKQDVQ